MSLLSSFSRNRSSLYSWSEQDRIYDMQVFFHFMFNSLDISADSFFLMRSVAPSRKRVDEFGLSRRPSCTELSFNGASDNSTQHQSGHFLGD